MSEEKNAGGTFQKKEIPGMFEGPILPVMVKLSLPIFTGMMFQLLYHIVDTIWVSRIDMSDPSYVGGTGIIYPIVFFAIAIGSGILIGTSSLVARSIGEHNVDVLNRTAESGLVMSFLISILFVALGYAFDEEIIAVLGPTGDYYVHALEYFRYILPAAALMFMGNVLNGILQGEGLVNVVMKAMMIATITNIVLDPVFIFLLNMGVRGAAVATVIAQSMAGVYVVRFFLMKKTSVQVRWKLKNADFRIMRKIASVGFPQTVGMITMALSFLFFNRIVVSIDPLALTAFSICGRFDQVIIFPILAISSSMITMTGQNYGRKNYHRVENIWKTGLLLSIGVVVFLAALLFVFAPKIYPFFTDVEKVVWYAVRQTRIVEFFFAFGAVSIIARAVFQAMGKPMPALGITIARLAGIAIPMAYFYVYVLGWGIHGVWFGIITGNVLAAIISIIWLGRRMKRMNRVSVHEPEVQYG
jgi:putative MATE family efflux protein